MIFEHELERLQAVRNPAQHGRTLFPHEYVEGQGSAMRLRFVIERYWRGEAAMQDKIWISIESAEDSLGTDPARLTEMVTSLSMDGSSLSMLATPSPFASLSSTSWTPAAVPPSRSLREPIHDSLAREPRVYLGSDRANATGRDPRGSTS